MKLQSNPAYLIKRLYAITPNELNTVELLRKTTLVLRGGARVLQYRNKLAGDSLSLEQAKALRALTNEYESVLIINDNVRLAQISQADGVHLGGGDGEISMARAQLGNDKIIGASCYNQLSLAHQSVLQGADYVAFGAFFASKVKPHAPVATLELLQRARAELTVPIVAIGGVTLKNGKQLVKAGADALAVISELFGAVDVQVVSRQFSDFEFL